MNPCVVVVIVAYVLASSALLWWSFKQLFDAKRKAKGTAPRSEET